MLEIVGFIALAYLAFKFAPQILEAAYKAAIVMIGLFFVLLILGMAWGHWSIYFN